jgi:hypothetical protein
MLKEAEVARIGDNQPTAPLAAKQVLLRVLQAAHATTIIQVTTSFLFLFYFVDYNLQTDAG